LELNEIIEKLQKIKKDIEDAFEIKLIDFDEIENGLASIIEAIRNQCPREKSGDKVALKPENYF